MATSEEVEQFKQQLAAAQQATAAAQQQVLVVQQNAEQEIRRIREEHAAGAVGGVAASLDGNSLATAFAQAMASAGVGTRAPREERDESELSGKKIGRAMPLYKGEGGDQYLRFERKFKAWADFNKLTEADKKTQLYLAFDGSAEQIVDIFGPESSVFKNNTFQAYADQIKSLFATRAQSEAAKSAFDVTVQLADENVQQYAAKKMSKFIVAYPGVEYTTSEYLIRVFIKDLRNDKVKEQVVLRGGSNMTYEEVVTQAANVEAGLEVLDNMKAMKSGYHVKVNQPKTVPATTEEPMELGALMASLQPLMKETVDSGAVIAALQQFRPPRDQHGRFLRGRGQRRGGSSNQGNNQNCWNCNESGHFQRECPKAWNNGGFPNRGRGRGNGGRGNSGRGRGGWRGFNAMGSEQPEAKVDSQKNDTTQSEEKRQAGESEKIQGF